MRWRLSVRGVQIPLLTSMGAWGEKRVTRGKGWKKTASQTSAWSSPGIFYLAPRAEWFSPWRKLEFEVDSFSPFPSFCKTARKFSPVPLPRQGAQSTIIFLVFLLQVTVAGISGWVSVKKFLRPSVLCCTLGNKGWAEGKLPLTNTSHHPPAASHPPPSAGQHFPPGCLWKFFNQGKYSSFNPSVALPRALLIPLISAGAVLEQSHISMLSLGRNLPWGLGVLHNTL